MLNKPLLSKLAALLDNVPPENFAMGHYGYSPHRMGSLPICATRACVMGWATTLPEVQELGFDLRAMADTRSADLFRKGQFVTGGDAAVELFGLSRDQAQSLVYDGDDDPKVKAQEIRRLCALNK